MGGYHGRYINLWLIDRIQWIGTIGVAAALAATLTFIFLYDIVKVSRRIKDAYRVAFPPAPAKEIEELEAEENAERENHSAYLPTEEGEENIYDPNARPEMIPVSVNFIDDMPITQDSTPQSANNENQTETSIESPAEKFSKNEADSPVNTEIVNTTETSVSAHSNEIKTEEEISVTDESKLTTVETEGSHEDKTDIDSIPMTIKTAAIAGVAESVETVLPESFENEQPVEIPTFIDNDTVTELENTEIAEMNSEIIEMKPAIVKDDDDFEDISETQNSVNEELAPETDFNITVNEIEEGTEDTSSLYDPTAELSRYQRPSLDLLIDRGSKTKAIDQEEQEENKERIIKTLKDYGIEISKIEATIGPTVTLYEIIPAEGVRIAKIKRLEDDIALSLAALGIRIIAPIPGKGTIGIEVPNKDQQTVSMRSVLGSKAFQECNYQLPMAMGATISNDIYIADLAKMPHLLVAGATGQGKSVGLNAIIASLLYKKHPSELKFVLVDPKMVEFSLYARLQNHFMAQIEGEEEAVITDPDKVERTLNSLCVEMDNRYNLLKDAGVRSLLEYNEKFSQRRLNPEKGHRYLPYIVIIVDEFADLIMMSGKAIETPIARIAQKARAVGMHMIIATQRPSANVITGIIRANFPGRIAFKVFSMVDSKVILDRSGANQLIGRGDMLFSHNGSMERVQCAFIDTPEVDAIVETISKQPGFGHPYFLPEPPAAEGEVAIGSITDRDALFEEAAQFLCSSGDTASTSSLQRKFSIGYNRAGKIMDQLESAGIVSAAQGSKPRNVLVDLFQLDAILSAARN
ncbi:MAG: DNA translocase FtsK [Muribaculaceae bacterium]|nr:DNA translocase FtsK [Muribaculaceae bacterium]